MPYSKNSFTYAGGAQTFTITFGLGYLEEADIFVYVEGELSGGDQIYRTFTFDSEFVVRVTEDLDVDDVVVIERTVSKTAFEVDFETGGTVTGRNLMIQFKQQFMLMQELLDGRIDDVDVTAQATIAAAAATSADSDATAAAASAAAAAASAASINLTDYINKDGSVAMTAALSLDGVTPTDDAHAASKKYVDDSVGGGGVMLLDGTQQMTGAMNLKAATDPTADDHAARKKYVDDADALLATLAAPTFTGVPAAPTASLGTNTTQLATTAFVIANAGSVTLDVQTFTASGTWTKPAGATFCYRELVGGGGSGAKQGSGNGGGGGAGGAFESGWMDASDLGATEGVVVGAGGAAQASVAVGNDGADTTFAGFIGYGGEGGRFGSSDADGGWVDNGYALAGNQWGATGGNATLGGSGDDGDDSYHGGAGGGGGGDTSSGGTGGTSVLAGDGGNGAIGASAGTAGSQPGGGGGGTETGTAGAGGDGRAIIYTF